MSDLNGLVITGIEVQPYRDRRETGIQAYATVTFNTRMVVTGFKVVAANDGVLSGQYPSSPRSRRCECGCKYRLLSNFCPGCGERVSVLPGDTERYHDSTLTFNPPQAGQVVCEAVLAAYHEHRPIEEPAQHRGASECCITIGRRIGESAWIGDALVTFLGHASAQSGRFRCEWDGRTTEFVTGEGEMFELLPDVFIGYVRMGEYKCRIRIRSPRANRCRVERVDAPKGAAQWAS